MLTTDPPSAGASCPAASRRSRHWSAHSSRGGADHAGRPGGRQMVEMKDLVLPRFREVFQYWRTVLRSGAGIGVLTGLTPGGGEDAGARMSGRRPRPSARKRISSARDRSTG